MAWLWHDPQDRERWRRIRARRSDVPPSFALVPALLRHGAGCWPVAC
jgi:hypothetical protein